MNFYKKKRVLVTGATGFKGAWLCHWLTMLGAEIFGIGYNPNKNKNLFYSLKLKMCKYSHTHKKSLQAKRKIYVYISAFF